MYPFVDKPLISMQYVMKRSWANLVRTCFSFLVISAGTAYPQQMGQIVGELHVVRGDFPGRTLVELQLRGAAINSQYTDEQGKFAFSSLTDNVYHIVIRDDRFYPVDERVMLDLSISAIKMVQINLTPHPSDSKNSLPAQQGGNRFIVDTEDYRRSFPKKARKEFEKGLESDREGNRDDAIRHYQKAIAVAPDFYPAHNNLGSDYLGKSDFPAAQAHFEQAIKMNQSDAEAHLNLGNLYLMKKDYGRAQQSVQEGLKRQPNSALGNFLLGSIYQRMGKLPEAERALHQALEIDPRMSRVHLELVNVYLAQHKTTEAGSEIKTFLKDSPNDPLAPKAREILTRLERNQ
jgi:tetratricopeptide (TPR) repeat protein